MELKEYNPMMGQRGVRLALQYPEYTRCRYLQYSKLQLKFIKRKAKLR